MSDNNDQNNPPEGKGPAEWWSASLTRRQATQTIAAGALVAGTTGLLGATGCCGDDQGPIVEQDALETQQKQGWDFGSQGRKLSLSSPQTRDSLSTEDWKTYLNPTRMLEAIRPVKRGWQAHERAVLIQSLSQTGLAEQLTPIQTPEMKEAYARGQALVSLISSVKDPEGTIVVVDMPGPASVALAASMAEQVEPVFFLDNWPHPHGVVPSHQTLGALLYHAAELDKKRAEREGKKLPAALILDHNRLNPYTDAGDAFDNRYMAEIPDATMLKKLGVRRVLYLTQSEKFNESDDLNEAMVALSESKIQVAMLSLSAFQKDPNASDEAAKATGGYFYGGGYHHHPYFFTYYPMFLFFPMPRYRWSSSPRVPSAKTAAKPTYKPAPRETVFSSKTKGAKAGVGKRKPTGFGRVSTRTNSEGRTTRVPAQSVTPRAKTRPRRRSGSFGRSRGGRFG